MLLAIGSTADGRPDWSRLLSAPPDWFRSAEGQRATANILSFQTVHGDWPKNVDTVAAPFAGDRRTLRGTFDNGATVNEIRFLARAHAASGETATADAVRRAVGHLLAAQYANGGWPQSHPPGEGYSRHITFNDGAMVNVMELLREVDREPHFAFLGDEIRRRARSAFARGVECILRCQVRVNGRLTVWAAQHDELTFEPRPARAFEPVALSAGESAGILRLLMSLPEPSPDVRRSIASAAAWYDEARLTGMRQVSRDGDKLIVRDSTAPPLWARFYEIGSNRPIFAGRDGVVRYRLADIERERRVGYAWYGEWGAAVARDFARWRQTVGAESAASPAHSEFSRSVNLQTSNNK